MILKYENSQSPQLMNDHLCLVSQPFQLFGKFSVNFWHMVRALYILYFVFLAQELGNNLEKCKNNETLQQILTNATIMVVSVTASTTQG